MKITREEARASGVVEGSDLWVKLFTPKETKLAFRVSPKGTVQCMGSRKFGMYLFAKEAQAILRQADELREFLVARHDELAWERQE